MVKKVDLITSRLVSFDDQPLRYSSWKISFQHKMTELDTQFFLTVGHLNGLVGTKLHLTNILRTLDVIMQIIRPMQCGLYGIA